MAVFDVLINNADRKADTSSPRRRHVYGVDHASACTRRQAAHRAVGWGKPVDDETLGQVPPARRAAQRLATR